MPTWNLKAAILIRVEDFILIRVYIIKFPLQEMNRLIFYFTILILFMVFFHTFPHIFIIYISILKIGAIFSKYVLNFLVFQYFHKSK